MMKTKCGEIKSMEDLQNKLFKKVGKEWILNPHASEYVQVIMEKVKCRACGEIFEVETPKGASHGLRTGILEKHIELHKTVKALGI